MGESREVRGFLFLPASIASINDLDNRKTRQLKAETPMLAVRAFR